MIDDAGEAIGNFASIVFYLACIAGWLTHLWVCFTEQLWLFLVAGAVIFPIGIIHGIGTWFGVW